MRKKYKHTLILPVAQGIVSSPYGYRESGFHMGTDYIATITAQVVAVWEGVIVEMATGCATGDMACGGGYGNYLTIDHQNGYFTRYAHLQSLAPALQKGQRVKKGQSLGIIGNTGHSFGAHLHFEVLTALAFYSTNPTAFLNPAPFLSGEKTFPTKKRKNRFIKALAWILGTVSLLFFMFIFYMKGYKTTAKPAPTLMPPDITDMGNTNL